MLESRSPSGSGSVTRSLFSLKPALPSRPPSGGAPPDAGDGAPEDVSERLLSTLRGAAQALPASVAPTSVRAIRSGQLVRALTEALAPERRRFEEELQRSRQRAHELEGELERIRAERRDWDETRRVELPRLAALVDEERTRVETLEVERAALDARAEALARELARRDAAARALEAALPEEDEGQDDALARVHARLEAIAAEVAAAPPATAAPVAAAADGRLVEALLSSEERAVRLAALEQRVAAFTGAPDGDTPPPGDAPAARAVLALLQEAQEEGRAREARLEGQLGQVLAATRDLHGALVEERRRRVQGEHVLRAALARLVVLEQREPLTRLPAVVVSNGGGGGAGGADVGPLLDALREEARRRDEGLEGRIQRLSLATRAALERMAEILDRALVAGLFDRDLPRLAPEVFARALGEAPAGGWPAGLARLDEVADDDLVDEEDDEDDDPPEPDDDPPHDAAAPPHDAPPGAGGGEGWDAGGADEASFLDQVVDADDVDAPATAEELDHWFHPGRPGQSEAEREAEQLAAFGFTPPPPAPVGFDAGGFDALEADQVEALQVPALQRAPAAGEGELEELAPDQAQALSGELEAERRRLEERVREAERALESEVWRGLATHRELVSTRQRLEELEARLATPAPEEPAPTLGGLEPIPELAALEGRPDDERAAVLSLDVDDRDSWVHWLLLENDPTFRGRRAREVERCAEAVRAAGDDELLHWLEAD